MPWLLCLNVRLDLWLGFAYEKDNGRHDTHEHSMILNMIRFTDDKCSKLRIKGTSS